MEYSKESIDRQAKIQAMKDAGIICYANHFHGKQNISDIRNHESEAKDVDILMENGSLATFKTAGRIMSSRGMGKLVFGKIRDHSGDIQMCFMRDKVDFNTGKEIVQSLEIGGETKTAFKIAEKFCQVGDYIGITGDLFLTKHGELTVFVKEFQVLSKAIRPLPEKFHGVTDQETIYRQRYLDLIMSDDSYNRFRLRSKFVKSLRDFYHNNEFIEIETPTLGNAASGAAAAPFITHHNDYNEEFFLRISPETALKQATVGRFERVVEFTRNFRNEGSDPSHMQEFSAIEHYGVWWNYKDNMQFTEDMFDFVFTQIPELSKEVEMKDKQGNARMVNFQTPWQRIDYVAGVKEACGIDVSGYFVGDEQKLIADIKAAGVLFEGMDKMGVPTLIDYLYKKVLRPSIVGPAFVYNYPKTMQPLARQSDENADIVEQFQVVVNGWEIIKAYSELVDPKIQAQNFDDQSGAIERGDEEATTGDDDFVLAMEYGMPCQSGWGMGIERVFSLLTGQENLRDVVLFPLMKSDKNGEEVKNEEK